MYHLYEGGLFTSRVLADFYGNFRRIESATRDINPNRGTNRKACSLTSTDKSHSAMFRIVGSLALMAASCQAALAADWQYCLAPSQAEHKVYMSEPFPWDGGPGGADSALDRALNRSGVRHDDVQCPRADDERSITAMRQQAINFNHLAGNEIVNLNWKP